MRIAELIKICRERINCQDCPAAKQCNSFMTDTETACGTKIDPDIFAGLMTLFGKEYN